MALLASTCCAARDEQHSPKDKQMALLRLISPPILHTCIMYEAAGLEKGVLRERQINFLCWRFCQIWGLFCLFPGPFPKDSAWQAGTLLHTCRTLVEYRASSYDVGMAQRLRFAPAILLLLPVTLFSGCKPKAKATPVTVHLLRNLNSLYGSELDRRLLDFQGSNPRLKSGQPIVIQSDTGDYAAMLQKQTGSNEDVDLIILDSPDDAKSNAALQVAAVNGVNVCAGLKACPANIVAIIPPQVTGAPREGAQAFVDLLQKTP
jgi:hypothetical protein